MKLLIVLLLASCTVYCQSPSPKEVDRYRSEAQRVTIIRDSWGVPHIYGKTDADAVFGLLYAQCEENFAKVEENNLEMMGRLSELYGETQLYNDLQMKLIYDTAAAIADYRRSPVWLKKLLDAAADGVNYYLYRHPEVKPAVLTRFEPWFALLRTNGSISATQNGGITTDDMKALYPVKDDKLSFSERTIPAWQDEPTGSNGLAAGPSRTASGNAILYINPHVSFYYRTEVQMVSDEGLDAYGAVTWGTFFVFQGFNSYCGWMHTTSYSDVADLFMETTEQRRDSLYTRYDRQLIPVRTKRITVRYKTEKGMGTQSFTAYYTKHGPVLGARNGRWLSLRENNRSLGALMQSWLRTKAKGFEEFRKVMDLRSNSSDNTVFADRQGHIAYWHGNFVPKRDPRFDYSRPVEGNTSVTDWHGRYALERTIHVYDPPSGYIQNCNSTPFTVSGSSSPRRQDYPVYMAPDGQNFRALNAVRLLGQSKGLTVDKMIHDIGYSHYLSFFDYLVPQLLRDFERASPADREQAGLAEAIDSLKNWDRNSSASSVSSTVAMEFGYLFVQQLPPAASPYGVSDAVGQVMAGLRETTPAQRLALLSSTLADLQKRFGTWKTTWGEVNRYQRPADGKFDDGRPSWPVGLAAATFGSLPSFATRRFPGTVRRYGVSGNSFIACIEFGKKIKAKSVITGGQSFDPSSRHYTDQAEMYINGQFKDVLFYREDVMKHAERQYHPGE